MSTITFDTHEFVKRLQGAGFSVEQAEVLTELQRDTVSNTLEQARHDYALDEIVSKRDLKELDELSFFSNVKCFRTKTLKQKTLGRG